MSTVISRAIIFEPITQSCVMPARQTPGSVGYDLYADFVGREVHLFEGGEKRVVATASGEITLSSGQAALIPLGFRAQFEAPLEAQLRLRSSVGLRGIVMPNAPGTIDPDYRDEWKLMLMNISPRPQLLKHGERLGQVIFSTAHTVDWQPGEVGVTDRLGGFGSTGR